MKSKVRRIQFTKVKIKIETNEDKEQKRLSLAFTLRHCQTRKQNIGLNKISYHSFLFKLFFVVWIIFFFLFI